MERLPAILPQKESFPFTEHVLAAREVGTEERRRVDGAPRL
jgi:hypothetical protein